MTLTGLLGLTVTMTPFDILYHSYNHMAWFK